MTVEDIYNQKKSIDIPYFMRDLPPRPLRSPQNIKIVKKEKPRKSSTKKILAMKTNFAPLKRQFKILHGIGGAISDAFSIIDKNNKLILGGVLVAGVGILALLNHLKKDVNERVETSPDDEGYVGENGRYDESDPKNGKKNAIKNKIIAEAERQRVDPALALAVADYETAGNFNQNSVSKRKAVGIFQVTPIACKAVGEDYNKAKTDIDTNIRAGIKYLKNCLNSTKSLGTGDAHIKAALIMYNAGPAAAVKQSSKATDHRKGESYDTGALKVYKKYKDQLNAMKPVAGAKPANITGTKVGNSILAEGVTISQPMKKFIEESGLKGYITSGIRANTPRKKESHWSGNKADIGLAGATREEIIQISVTLMKHPAIVHIAYECFGPKGDSKESIRISKGIQDEIKRRYPSLAERMTENVNEAWKTNKFKVYHWGWEYGTGPHIDFLINPDKVGLSNNNVPGNNQNKPNNTKISPKNKVQNKNQNKNQNKVNSLKNQKPSKTKNVNHPSVKIPKEKPKNTKKVVNIGQVNSVKANKSKSKK